MSDQDHAVPMPPSARGRRAWQIAYWLLFGVFVSTAVLNMAHVRAGFLTSYAADLFLPPWLYIAMRRLATTAPSRNPLFARLGRSPETAAGSLFLASAATELSQIRWPKGIFRGTFDPLDIVAYAAGLAACYAVDRWQRRTGTPHRGFAAQPDQR